MRVKSFENLKKPFVNAKALNLKEVLLLRMPYKSISSNGNNNSMRKKSLYFLFYFLHLANRAYIGQISTFLHPSCLKGHIEISEEERNV